MFPKFSPQGDRISDSDLSRHNGNSYASGCPKRRQPHTERLKITQSRYPSLSVGGDKDNGTIAVVAWVRCPRFLRGKP